jgi:copper(I)-binding protein
MPSTTSPPSRTVFSRPGIRRERGAHAMPAIAVAAALLAFAPAFAQPAGAPGAALPAPGSAPTREATPGAGPASIEAPWVRATVAKQRSTGAFLRLTARERVKLVGVESPVADIVELHEMALVDNVMRMRAVDSIPLEPGQSLELRPGGYHVMLIDLRQQVKVGDPVPLTLVFEDDKGRRITQAVTAAARSLTDTGRGEGPADHGSTQHGNSHGDMKHGDMKHGNHGARK